MCVHDMYVYVCVGRGGGRSSIYLTSRQFPGPVITDARNQGAESDRRCGTESLFRLASTWPSLDNEPVNYRFIIKGWLGPRTGSLSRDG